MTAQDAITRAMRLIGVLASGETPSAAQSSDGLTSLNAMLDQWNAERLAIFTIQRQVFTLVSGQQAYTMGTGGDFDVPRPAKIERVGIVLLTNPAQPVELPIEYLTDAQWAAIPIKNIESSLPQYVWDDGGFPFRTLSYWVVPNVACQTTIYTWTALSSFSTLTTDNTFPPGYEKAIVYNLALELAPEYGVTVDSVVAGQANQAKAIVKSMNIPIIDLQVDQALVFPRGTAYNYKTDMPAGWRKW